MPPRSFPLPGWWQHQEGLPSEAVGAQALADLRLQIWEPGMGGAFGAGGQQVHGQVQATLGDVV